MSHSAHELRLTRHVGERAQQRGYLGSDICFVLEHGTPVKDGVLLTRKDANHLISDLKFRMTVAERLAGTRIIEKDGDIITVFRPDKRQTRRLLNESAI